MVDGRFVIAGLGSMGFSFMLYVILKYSLESLQKATSQQGIEWIYVIHMASAVIGIILLLIGIFKKKSST